MPAPVSNFPLATFVARRFVGIGVALAIALPALLYFAEGPRTAFEAFFRTVLNLLPWLAFAHFLPHGSRIAAILFGLLCLWYLLGSFSGGPTMIGAIGSYALGVLGFVGIVAVVKEFPRKGKTTPMPHSTELQ